MLIKMASIKKFVLAFAILLTVTAPSIAADVPQTMRWAGVFPAVVENAWIKSFVDSFNRVKLQKPEGVELTLDYTESVWGDKAMTILSTYAASKKYDVIWGHSSYSDVVEKIAAKYPSTIFVVVGAGNRPLGKNVYLMYPGAHEAAYLLGVMGGMMTKRNLVGVVGLFPSDDINDQVNAFRAGAQSVNPKVKAKISFVESWYDPVKASEAANAQISAGADMIYQLGEAFEPCRKRKILCFGNYIDMYSVAPTAVVASSILRWDPYIEFLTQEWKKHKATGAPYAGPTKDPIVFSMAAGGSSISEYHGFDKTIPTEVKEKIKSLRADIASGKLKIPVDRSKSMSD